MYLAVKLTEILTMCTLNASNPFEISITYLSEVAFTVLVSNSKILNHKL